MLGEYLDYNCKAPIVENIRLFVRELNPTFQQRLFKLWKIRLYLDQSVTGIFHRNKPANRYRFFSQGIFPEGSERHLSLRFLRPSAKFQA